MSPGDRSYTLPEQGEAFPPFTSQFQQMQAAHLLAEDKAVVLRRVILPPGTFAQVWGHFRWA